MLTECEWERLLDEGTLEDLYEAFEDYDRLGYASHVPIDVLSRLEQAGYYIGDFEDDE